jgi:hypothetical protein
MEYQSHGHSRIFIDNHYSEPFQSYPEFFRDKLVIFLYVIGLDYALQQVPPAYRITAHQQPIKQKINSISSNIMLNLSRMVISDAAAVRPLLKRCHP